MTQVWVKNQNGVTDRHPFNRLEEEQEIGAMWTGTVVAERESFENGPTMQTGQSEVAVLPDGVNSPTNDRIFWGRLSDIEYRDETVHLKADSWESYAREAPLPSSSELANDFNTVSGSTGVDTTGMEARYENTRNSQIVEDIVGYVDILSPGNIATTTDRYDITFSNISPGRILRRQEIADDPYIHYNYDKTVDYEPNPGRDRTNITLEQGTDVVFGDWETIDEGFDDGFSTILLQGAGSGGNDQISEQININPGLPNEISSTSAEQNFVSQEHHTEPGHLVLPEEVVTSEVHPQVVGSSMVISRLPENGKKLVANHRNSRVVTVLSLRYSAIP